MAEPNPGEQADLALLADIANGRVADDQDCRPRLYFAGEQGGADVGEAVWRFERMGWVVQPPQSEDWELTQRGLDVLQGRRNADG